MSKPFQHPSLPFPLTPSQGSEWNLESDRLSATAAPRSDLFVDPGTVGSVNAVTMMNAHRALGPAPEGDFQFSARVEADLTSQFDAGVLLLWLDDDHWAKLCYEYSPDAERMVVSVVNREGSDDANAFTVDGTDVWLRIARVGKAFAFHASRDGQRWEFVREFGLDASEDAQIGFSAQSPTGEGCDVAFDNVSFNRETLANLRDGS
ncbi:DUF1349 domain-containing protein [Tessaracoccus rhinocerotis]|uniref:DUF1349 domain-containing protein n=1 Tax=Tessaracoccus rhinocerotis TaxID=1689449 RepID=A0A553K6A3_9ACTN|nr:DUF1349 domain-containing protein [Tessaracoccus rhinocerotis]TRY20239.1 DUF1349 domain-containing protein [Tessaracoccus rhinocerotis]